MEWANTLFVVEKCLQAISGGKYGSPCRSKNRGSPFHRKRRSRESFVTTARQFFRNTKLGRRLGECLTENLSRGAPRASRIDVCHHRFLSAMKPETVYSCIKQIL